MRSITLHDNASALTLAGARVLVGVVWIVRLIGDPVSRLGYLPDDLWFGQGLLTFLPDETVALLTTSTAFTAMKMLGIALALWLIFGLKGGRIALVTLTVTMALYLGLTKGFGGHLNHRELVLLYVTAVLLVTPCFDAMAYHGSKNPLKDASVYRASMLAICLTIAISYMFIGVARLAIGFPGVFHPDVMAGWLLDRAVRPNPVGSRLGAVLLAVPGSRLLLATMLPTSTALELAAPTMLWVRKRIRYLILSGLAFFHLAILAFMNITFIENILLLILFIDYTPFLQRLVSKGVEWRQRSPATM